MGPMKDLGKEDSGEAKGCPPNFFFNLKVLKQVTKQTTTNTKS